MKRSGGEPEPDAVERAEAAEALGHADDLDQGRPLGRREDPAHRLMLSSRGAPASV